MNNRLLIEIFKHLPGKHNQQTHGHSALYYQGETIPGSIKEQLDEDNLKTNRLFEAADKVHHTTTLSGLTDDEGYFYNVNEEMAQNWQAEFEDTVRKAKRFYRGVEPEEIINLEKNGKLLAPALRGYTGPTEEDDYDEGDTALSLTLSINRAADFGEFILEIDGDKAREQGAFPRHYPARLKRLGMDAGTSELEVEVPGELSADSINRVYLLPNVALIYMPTTPAGPGAEYSDFIKQNLQARELYLKQLDKATKALKKMGLRIYKAGTV